MQEVKPDAAGEAKGDQDSPPPSPSHSPINPPTLDLLLSPTFPAPPKNKDTDGSQTPPKTPSPLPSPKSLDGSGEPAAPGSNKKPMHLGDIKGVFSLEFSQRTKRIAVGAILIPSAVYAIYWGVQRFGLPDLSGIRTQFGNTWNWATGQNTDKPGSSKTEL